MASGRSVVVGKHGGRLLREMFNRVGSRSLPPILDLATETWLAAAYVDSLSVRLLPCSPSSRSDEGRQPPPRHSARAQPW